MTNEQVKELFAPTGLDKTIARVFPGWGAKRLVARREFAYEAAKASRLRKSAPQIAGPEDFNAFSDRLGLIREVRDLVQNFGLFKSIVDKIDLYAFGTLKYQSHTGDEKIDDLSEQYLEYRFANCDLSGRHNFRSMVSIADKSAMTDGDYAWKWSRDNGELKLTGIESDRIGGGYGGYESGNYFQGITVDPLTGKPVSFRIYNRNKSNSYTDPIEVPASDILFLADQSRYDQYRGITPFAPVVTLARDFKEVFEACLIGTKFENMHAAVGYTEGGSPLIDPSEVITSSDLGGNSIAIKEQAIKAGLIQWAPTGSKVDFMKSERPSGNFQTYIDMLVRHIGVALNLPYGFIYQMLGTGPAVRAEMQQAYRVIQGRQTNMRERMLDPVKNTFLMEGIASGEIPYSPKWFRGGWQFPAWPTIDSGRDSNSMIKELAAGVRSKASIFAENGEDQHDEELIIREEVEKTITEAKALAEKHDVDFNLVLTMLDTRTPNGYLFTSGSTAGISPQGEGTDANPQDNITPQPVKSEMSARVKFYEDILIEKKTKTSRNSKLESIYKRLK